MNSNIYQVLHESDLMEILTDNKNKLVSVMITDNSVLNSTVNKQLKQKYYDLSKKNSDMFFTYIDLKNFKVSPNQQFTKDIQIPRFGIYVNFKEACIVEGLDFKVFELIN